MRLKNYKIDWSYLLLVFPVLRISWPALQYRTRMRTAFAFVMIWAGIMLLRNRRVVKEMLRLKESLVILIISFGFYIGLPIVYNLLGYGSRINPGDFVVGWLYAGYMLIAYFSVKLNRHLEFKALLFVLISGFLLSAVAAHGASKMEDTVEFSRVLTNSEGKEDLEITAKLAGVGGYDHIYMCAILAPIFLFCTVKCRNFLRRIIFAVAAFSCAVNVQKGGLGTPYFVMVVELVFLFFSYCVVYVRKHLLLIGLLAPFILSLFTFNPTIFSFLSEPIRAFSSLVPAGGSIQMRVESVADMLAGDQYSYAFGRYRLQERSWDTFCKKPIIGNGGYLFPDARALDVGGHSLLLDRMARFGVFGFLTYFFYYFSQYFFMKRVRLYMCDQTLIFLAAIFLSAFLFASFANPFHAFFPIYFFLPVLVAFMQQDEFIPVSYRRFGAAMSGGMVWR